MGTASRPGRRGGLAGYPPILVIIVGLVGAILAGGLIFVFLRATGIAFDDSSDQAASSIGDQSAAAAGISTGSGGGSQGSAGSSTSGKGRAKAICDSVAGPLQLTVDGGDGTCFAERNCVSTRSPRCEVFLQVFIDRQDDFAKSEVADRRTKQWRPIAVGDEGVETPTSQTDSYEIFFRRGTVRVSVRVMPAFKADALPLALQVDAKLK